jgi:AcrR family transcriptional regulator
VMTEPTQLATGSACTRAERLSSWSSPCRGAASVTSLCSSASTRVAADKVTHKRTVFVAESRVPGMPSRRAPFEEREPLTPERIAQAALEIVEESGYAALSMRAVAGRLNTGQASLYAHVRNKADLDRIMVESAWTQFQPSTSGSWRERLASDAAQIQQLYARYPGLAVAAFASLPRSERLADALEDRYELLLSLGLDLRQAQAASIALALVPTARAIEDAVIAERIAESGLTADEWWQRVRSVLADDLEAWPLTAQTSSWLNPADRAGLSAELVQLVLDGIQARYGVHAQGE